MTVGELVYQQAIKDGYKPGELSPELKKVAESYQKAFDTMREPMRAVSSMVETMQEPMRRATEAASSMAEALRPEMEAMSKIRLPEMPALPSSSFIPSSFYGEDGEFILPEYNRIQEVRIVNPEDIAVPAVRTEREMAASYQLPGNAKWELLEMQFIDGHLVRVSYPGMESKKFDFREMGFMNERTVRPDMKWELLRTLASHGGSLTTSYWDRRFHRNIKYELNDGLKRFFGMTENPIPRYTKRRGYEVLFSIRTDR